MPMNVQAIPNLDDRINEIRLKTAEIVNQDILPNENKIWAWREGDIDEQTRRMDRLRSPKSLSHAASGMCRTISCIPILLALLMRRNLL